MGWNTTQQLEPDGLSLVCESCEWGRWSHVRKEWKEKDKIIWFNSFN